MKPLLNNVLIVTLRFHLNLEEISSVDGIFPNDPIHLNPYVQDEPYYKKDSGL